MTLVALHGGGASKVSEIYENAWTLYSMLDLLAGRANAIKLEPPGSAGHGFEFFVRRGDREEWHQVKYQHSKGKWTLYELYGVDVLRRFKDKLLSDASTSCRFISASSSFPLSKLCAHAGKAVNLEVFKDTYLSSQDLIDGFEDLRDRYWELPEQTLWEWLHGRVFVQAVDDEFLEQTLEERLATYVSGTPNNAFMALDKIKREALYEVLTAAELQRKLTDSGCPPRVVSRERGSVSQLVRDASRELASEIEELLIHDTFSPRDALKQARALLELDRPPQTVLLTGQPGCGKSSVLGQLISWALTSDWTVLSLDVSTLARERDTAAVGARLQLPMPPARALALAAEGERALLVVDALDSVSWNRQKPVELFPVVARVIAEAKAHPHLTVVISCRSEDLDADERLRGLAFHDASLEEITVPPLPVNQVMAILTQAGVDHAELDEAQLALVTIPANLKLLVGSADAGPFDFRTAEQLKDRYLAYEFGRIA